MLPEAVKLLKSQHLNINYYIDSNHVKLFVDQLTWQANKSYQEMFKVLKLGQCPKLPTSKDVYDEFIHLSCIRLERNVKHLLAAQFTTSFGRELITEDDLWWAGLSEKLPDAKAFFKTPRGKKRGWDTTPPEILDISPYMNFFVGGGPDIPFLLNTLKKELRNETDPYSKQRIEEFINDFQSNKGDRRLKTREAQKKAQFDLFKEALHEFNDKHRNRVSEVNEGQTRFNLLRGRPTLIEFQEKAVDTKLIMKCMDDLSAADDSDVFVFVTNDTDFAPLLERVAKTHQVIWLQGGENRAKGLEATVGKARVYELRDFFLTRDPLFPKMPETQYWDENILKPIYPDIDELRWHYLQRLADHEWEEKRAIDWEKWLQVQMEEDEFFTEENSNNKPEKD